MELVKERFHMSRRNGTAVVPITLDADFNVPDSKEDVRAIMHEKGEVVIEDIRLMEEKVMVTGHLEISSLYVSEPQTMVGNLVGEIPIQETVSFPKPIVREDEITIHAVIDDLRVELINSRKYRVKAVINMEVTADCIDEGEGAVELEADDSIFRRKKEKDITELLVSKRDTLRIHDECGLPANRETVGQILSTDVCLQEMNYRIGEDKLVISGEADLFVIYLSAGDEKICTYECVIPIDGEVHCGGCNENDVVQTEIGLRSKEIEVKQDEDGEERIFDMELVLELGIKVYGESRISLLTDFYSTERECQPIYEEYEFEQLLMKNKIKFRVDGQIHTDVLFIPKKIWKVFAQVRVDEQRKEKDGMTIEGVLDVRVLYESEKEEIPLASARGLVAFEQHILIPNMDENTYVQLLTGVDQVVGNINGENEIEIKATVWADAICFEHVKESVICDVVEKELDCEKLAKGPGFVGYVVKEKEELWDVAKAFYTSVENIMEVNELEEEVVKPGDALLIVREAKCM